MSDCTNGTRTTPNKLRFNIQCDTDVRVSYFQRIDNVESLDDCLVRCSIHWGPAPFRCAGVTYKASNRRCFLQPIEVRTAETTVSDAGVALAISDASQFDPLPTTCPFPDGSTLTAANGLPFRMSCGNDYDGDDMDLENPPATRMHTDTMAECIEICSTARRLCLGVAWLPTLSLGYPNCFPKTRNDPAGLVKKDLVIHSALAMPSYNGTCIDGVDHVAAGKTFRISCLRATTKFDYKGGGDDDDAIADFHEPDLGACMDRCAQYSEEVGSAPLCQAVIYDGSSRFGYENCYLRRGVGQPQSSDGLSLAVVTSNGTNDDGGDSEPAGSDDNTGGGEAGSSGRPNRTGVIVGPIIGGLVVIALLIAGLWLWKKRQKTQSVENVREEKNELPQDNITHELPGVVSIEPSELETTERPQQLRG